MLVNVVLWVTLYTLQSRGATLPPGSTLGDASLQAPNNASLPAWNVECDGVLFGDNLAPDSCHNAWAKILRTTPPRIYIQRPGVGRDRNILLPVRFLSGNSPFIRLVSFILQPNYGQIPLSIHDS